MSENITIKNKKAYFEYHILDKYECGIELLGTEIKSIRSGKANLTDGFCTFVGNELYAFNIHISEYSMGSFYNHEPKRNRKLLLTKKELRKLQIKTQDKGMTIVPLQIFFNERGFAKMEIALAQGKKLHDKRDTMKERDAKIEISRYNK
ncbi:MAG: SsrA-binding protein SmpB [Sphingobacteriales bacterium]|nr:SsrA-binding protein SmpB [Sphingobacteriales bacterium]